MFNRSCATSITAAGFHFAVATASNAQDQLNYHVRPENDGFETAANLELWPRILLHYRYIRYLETSPSRNVVVMAARRSGIPISAAS
jgi:hypothetical protein